MIFLPLYPTFFQLDVEQQSGVGADDRRHGLIAVSDIIREYDPATVADAHVGQCDDPAYDIFVYPGVIQTIGSQIR